MGEQKFPRFGIDDSLIGINWLVKAIGFLWIMGEFMFLMAKGAYNNANKTHQEFVLLFTVEKTSNGWERWAHVLLVNRLQYLIRNALDFRHDNSYLFASPKYINNTKHQD